ncbi:MAG: aminoacyl-tRNA hydrolase [Halobacteriovoraceae bacterium]|nr:aminoacyl-tRNA hydrolase [Halobacteriovoraceae bacterium]
MIKLVVGLGNPGAKYEFTKHNIGWILLDQYPPLQSANWKSKWKGEYAELTIDGEKVYFLKPQTYMNLSGESVQPMAQFFKIEPDEILVVHDELDLPFGTLVLKNGGGLAGHNGLKSISERLGTNNYLRMRMGIRRADIREAKDFVLSAFKDSEIPDLEKFMKGSVEALDMCLKKDFKAAQTKYNRRNFCEDK